MSENLEKRLVYLFQPNFKIGEGKFTNYWMPYSVGCIWSSAKNHDDIDTHYELGDLFFRRDNLDTLLKSIKKPAVLGFSGYIWNWNYLLHIAEELKNYFPEATVLFGGPQVPENSQDFLERYPFIDVACIAEGEETFTQILRELINPAPDLTKVPGCLARGSQGETIITPEKPRLELDSVPSPYLSGVFDALVKDNPEIAWNTTIETTRGCPFACTFCDWGSLIFAKIKKFPEEQVMNELEWISKNRIDYVFAADPNFGVFPDRDRRIVDKLIGCKDDLGYPKTINIQWYKNSNETIVDLAQSLTKASLNRALTLSMQSLDPKVLTAIKRKNIAFSNLGELLELCRKKDIPTYTELILGLPEETLTTWESGLCQLLELGQHNTIEVWLCELIENAELNSKAAKDEYAIETSVVQNHFEQSKDESLDIPEEIEVVSGTKSMPHEDLIQAYLFTWIIINIHVYGWSQMYSRFLRKHISLDYHTFYKKLQIYIQEHTDSLLHSEYKDCEKLIRNYFAEKKFDNRYCDYSGIMLNGKTALWKSQFVFHNHHKTITKELEDYFSQYEIDQNLSLELQKYQQAYVTNIEGIYPHSQAYSFNFKEFIDNEEISLKPKRNSYHYELRESFNDRKDYTLMLYFRRRQGWGKAKVTNSDLGEQVEPRRNFIEDNALKVDNLDY